jgi:ubiquinone/menaquinone biosynthesis C-methylase UbiE
MGTSRSYVPAAGHDWLLPLYDPLVSLLGGDTARKALLDQAAIRSTHRILDIGCGTGTLALLIKRIHPDVELVGLDPDPKALARARRKAERAGVSVQFDQGYSDELPYAAASFDRVFSSFMLHHLPVQAKERTLREVGRVLAPDGFLHVLDFAEPASRPRWLTRLHSSERLERGAEDRLLPLLRHAGFTDPQVVAHRPMLFASLAYYQASTQASEAGVA